MARKPSALPPPAECANCGADIPPRAHACPECGADERTGWRETSVYDGLELPDSAWSDDDVEHASDARDEAPADRIRRAVRARDVATQRRGELPWYWLVVAVLLLGTLVLGSLALLR